MEQDQSALHKLLRDADSHLLKSARYGLWFLFVLTKFCRQKKDNVGLEDKSTGREKESGVVQ